MQVDILVLLLLPFLLLLQLLPLPEPILVEESKGRGMRVYGEVEVPGSVTVAVLQRSLLGRGRKEFLHSPRLPQGVQGEVFITYPSPLPQAEEVCGEARPEAWLR